MNAPRLFLASCFALIATSMSFAIRGDIMPELGEVFSLDKEQLGYIAGTAFWGFTLAMIIGGPLCDFLGMKRLVWIALIGHVAGILITIFANGFWMLFGGTLAIGIANGMVEAACNPLIATLYSNDKTTKLNQFHVWFPGGIVIGGLACYFLALADFGWQIKMMTMLAPVVVYLFLFLGQAFPKTERVTAGVTDAQMFKSIIRPLFMFLVVCMLLTAATELGPNQWIPDLLTASAGVSGILVLVWINGIMMAGRQFAGPMVHRLSPPGVLLISAVLSMLGLLALSYSSGRFSTFAAATLFAIGVCYFWPTMLGYVAERCPRTGALGLAIMGGAGMLSVALVLPMIGWIYDANIEEVGQAAGGALTLRIVAILPAILIVAFGGLWLADKKRGGYRSEKLAAAGGK